MKRSTFGVSSLILLLAFLVLPWRAAFTASPRPQVATSHSVTLTWTASTTAGVTYTVYRATSAAGPFTAISSGISSLTYTDTTAVDGTQYFYEVDAVDTVGGVVEDSGPSNEVNATEPISPNPPTGLAAVSK